MTPRSVWLVRHGQTDWNLQRRYLSHSDRALTPFGEQQAQALGTFFHTRKIDAILHTGLSRSESTARAIRGARNIDIACDDRWREANHGAWEGLTYHGVMLLYREDALRRFEDPIHTAPLGGESLAQMTVRILEAWRSLGERFAGKRIIIVSHGGPIQALLSTQMNTPLTEHWRWRIDLGSATGIDCYAATTILRAVNQVPMIHRKEAKGRRSEET